MRRQSYLDYAYAVADLVWRDYEQLREEAIEEDKTALRDSGVLRNPFRFVGPVAPCEIKRFEMTQDSRFLDRAKSYLLDVYEVYDELRTYQETHGITVENSDFPALDWMFDPEHIRVSGCTA